MPDFVIQSENISKIYKLYGSPNDRLKEALNPFGKKYHKDHYALKNVSFQIVPGETVGIIGANGAGKSTLLKIITGVLTPSSGSMQINGRISALLELGAGMNPELTGFQNIYFMGSIAGFNKNEIDAKVQEIINFVDIGDYIHQPVKTYSSGMMARLGFAVAVHTEPDILIIDEALSVGDIRFQQKAIRKMEDMMQKAKAILFVSHSMDTVRKMCKRCIWINNGEVFEDGEARIVTQHFYSFMNNSVMHKLRNELHDKTSKYDLEKYEIGHQLLDLSNYEQNGDGGVYIKKAAIVSSRSLQRIDTISNGEELSLLLLIESQIDIEKPAIEFFLKNSLGIKVFAINSFLMDLSVPSIKKNSKYLCKLSFIFPPLLNGDYSVTINLSDVAFYPQKVKYHQVFDALIVKTFDSSKIQNHASLILPEKASFEVVESVE